LHAAGVGVTIDGDECQESSVGVLSDGIPQALVFVSLPIGCRAAGLIEDQPMLRGATRQQVE